MDVGGLNPPRPARIGSVFPMARWLPITQRLIAPDLGYVDCLQFSSTSWRMTRRSWRWKRYRQKGGPASRADYVAAARGAFTRLVVTFADGSDRDKYAVRLGCSPIDSGHSLLATSIFVPARLFNEQRGLPLLFPPAITTFDEFSFQGDHWPGHCVDSPQMEKAAKALSRRSWLAPNRPLSDWQAVWVSPISSSNRRCFSAIGSSGAEIPLGLVWSLPVHPLNSTASIRPGDVALFQVVLDDSVADRGFTLYYTPHQDRGFRLRMANEAVAAPVARHPC